MVAFITVMNCCSFSLSHIIFFGFLGGGTVGEASVKDRLRSWDPVRFNLIVWIKAAVCLYSSYTSISPDINSRDAGRMLVGLWWNSWARSFSHSWQSPWGGKESAALKRWSCLLWGRWVSDKLFKLQTHQCNYIFTQKLMNEWMNRATCDYRTRLLGVLLHQKQLCHCIVWNVCCVTVDS